MLQFVKKRIYFFVAYPVQFTRRYQHSEGD